MNSWDAYVEQSGNKKLVNIPSKVSQNNLTAMVVGFPIENMMTSFVFFLHVCNKYTKSRPNILLITVHLKLMGISSRPGVTTNVNVGGSEMTTSTGLKSLKCQTTN